MKIRFCGPTVYFMRFVAQAKIILATWAKFVVGVILISMLFSGVLPLVAAAIIFTLFLPIILLVLWGQALEVELGWTDPDRWKRLAVCH